MNFWETDLQERVYARSNEYLEQFGDRLWIEWAREMVAIAKTGKQPLVSPMLLAITKLSEG
jgi:hypothetical protein